VRLNDSTSVSGGTKPESDTPVENCVVEQNFFTRIELTGNAFLVMSETKSQK
jgi:hypothetical protein